MTYLNTHNTPEVNFSLMANEILTTEEALDAKERFASKDFGIQIRVHVIGLVTSVALAILFCKASVIGTAGMIAVIGWIAIKLMTLIHNQAHEQRKLEDAFAPVNTIYRKVIQYIDLKRETKAASIAQSIDNASFGMTYTNENFPKNFSSIAYNYNMQNRQFSENIMNIILTGLDQDLNPRTKIIPAVDKEIWKKFLNVCKEYGTCSALYKKLATQYKITAPQFEVKA